MAGVGRQICDEHQREHRDRLVHTKSVFILKLPAIAQTPDLRVSLAMLLGETPYDPSRESTYLTLRAHDGPFDFNPALFPPEQTVWDPRRACWIDVNAAICACLG